MGSYNSNHKRQGVNKKNSKHSKFQVLLDCQISKRSLALSKVLEFSLPVNHHWSCMAVQFITDFTISVNIYRLFNLHYSPTHYIWNSWASIPSCIMIFQHPRRYSEVGIFSEHDLSVSGRCAKQDIQWFIWSFCANHQEDWSDFLPLA